MKKLFGILIAVMMLGLIACAAFADEVPQPEGGEKLPEALPRFTMKRKATGSGWKSRRKTAPAPAGNMPATIMRIRIPCLPFLPPGWTIQSIRIPEMRIPVSMRMTALMKRTWVQNSSSTATAA